MSGQAGNDGPIGARLAYVLMGYDELTQSGISNAEALTALYASDRPYD